jgi:hypothetical protein
MNIEHSITPADGTVDDIYCQAGELIKVNAELLHPHLNFVAEEQK